MNWVIDCISTSEDNWHVDNAPGHVEGLGGGVDDLVDGLHGEVEGHELEDGPEVVEGRPHRQPCEPHLRDGRVDDPLVPVLLPEPPGDLVGAVVLSHLLTHDENLNKC